MARKARKGRRAIFVPSGRGVVKIYHVRREDAPRPKKKGGKSRYTRAQNS